MMTTEHTLSLVYLIPSLHSLFCWQTGNQAKKLANMSEDPYRKCMLIISKMSHCLTISFFLSNEFFSSHVQSCFMFQWWKSRPMTKPADRVDPSTPKKSVRPSVSFFLDQQDAHRKPVQNTSIELDFTRQKRDPTLEEYRGQAIDPLEQRSFLERLLQLLDELIKHNNACFGFSLVHVPSKSCLYLSIFSFLGICLIISLAAMFKS